MDGGTLAKSTETSRGSFILSPYGWMVALVLVLSAAFFTPAMRGKPVWDDEGFMSGATVGGGNSLIACFTEPFNHSYFRPLVSLSIYLDRQLLGNNTFVYHTTNLLYHVLTVAVLIALVLAAFGDRRLALFAGLLFGVQPVQVSTVAWIGGRTDSICTLFVALMALGAVNWARTSRWVWLLLALCGLFCAALTKEQAIALFPTIPLAAVCYGDSLGRRRRLLTGGIASVSVAVSYLSLWLTNYPNPMEATASRGSDRIELFLQTVAHYGLLLTAPNLERMHMFSLSNHDSNHNLWMAVGGFLTMATVLLAYILWNRSRVAFWFLALVALGFGPVSNILPMPSLTVAPYRVGIVGLGVAVLIAYGFWLASNRWRMPAAAFGGAYAGACAVLVAVGSTSWTSNEALFRTITKYDRQCLVARLNLTDELAKQGRWREVELNTVQVLDYLFQSGGWRRLESVPTLLQRNPEILARVARNQGNRVEATELVSRFIYFYGGSREQAGASDKALLAYQAASEVEPSFADPIVAAAWLVEESDPEEAERGFHRALILDPRQSGAARYLGEKAEEKGDLVQAVAYYRKAAEGTPWSGEYPTLAAQVLYRMGRYEEALSEIHKAEGRWSNRKALQALKDQIESGRGT